MDFSEFEIIIVNSSAGKDSLAALWEVCRIAKEQGYPLSKIIVSHQDLGSMEWEGTKELAKKQADFFGLEIMYSKRRDKNGYEETLLEYVRRRKKWPSNKQRFCTSDFKRGPGARVVTFLTKGMTYSRVLYVFGFRADESPARAKKEVFKQNIQLSTKSREVWEWLPIHEWTTKKVWETIKSNKLPYHRAYDLGMPRLSCVFCIFSPFDALVIAGKNNPELLEEYVSTEKKIGHSFRNGFTIGSVQQAINEGYEPKSVNDWVM